MGKKNYGIPYMGSKNKIAEWIVSHFPSAENFYDLCCGGCAITHYAMEQRKYKNYIINDIEVINPQTFIDAINGKFKNENRWISREDFFKLGDTNAYVRFCFSFGNKGTSYAYSKGIEQLKKAAHYAIYFDDYSLLREVNHPVLTPNASIRYRYLEFKKFVKPIIGRFDLQSLERLERLQSLERLERLQSLERLESLMRGVDGSNNITSHNLSYNEVTIKNNSVIYCDIPYKGTAKYGNQSFDYDKFYSWCEKQTQPLFISEYYMPEDRFICIDQKEKACYLSAINNSNKSIEKLFIPKHQIELYKKTCLF